MALQSWFTLRQRGWALWCLHQPVIGWGLPLRRECDLGLGSCFWHYGGRGSPASCQQTTSHCGKNVLALQRGIWVACHSIHYRGCLGCHPGSTQPTTWPQTHQWAQQRETNQPRSEKYPRRLTESWKIRNSYVFKLLSFEVVYYVVIDNWCRILHYITL